MQEIISQLVNETEKAISVTNELRVLNDLKVEVLGKSGKLTAYLRGLKDVSAEERPKIGQYVNDARVKLEGAFDKAETILKQADLNRKLAEEKIDITLPYSGKSRGALHPLTQVRERIIGYFVSLGFGVVDTPEIETDYYNFSALNIPPDHPARDAQDTLFVADNIVLRSHTSTGQIRVMEKQKPPIKVISHGRVYRADEPDATHSPMFHQLEGLVIDKGVTMCDLKGILDGFASFIFGAGTTTRLRPSYFPFTEPSVEVDASCAGCKGAGCRICKGTGWIEILGAGIVNRRVLEGCGINPDIYSGFAFGMGLDRITTILYGINDLRVMFDNDMRFLKQFV
ncbi:MAG: phenylalanine--tRNA ligase subunit alpha [Firmicutes bacterium]|nr:phenylalanine--tRNA ligase subunit alpha [Bacillota bacterium]